MLYEVIKIVHNGQIQYSVNAVDALNLKDKDGEDFGSDWLEDRLAYLNGKKSIGDKDGEQFSSRTLQVSHFDLYVLT